MPTTVWVATANIYLGEGVAYVLAYTPGNRVPDSVVSSLGLATSGLVQQATINEDGTSPNWRGTDPITRSELDAALAALPTGGNVDSVNAQTGVVVLDADDIPDTATKVLMDPAERVKLGGVATAATANAPDSQLRDRTTHTGTQAAATISDLTEVVQDIVGALIVAGTNTTVSYNDAAGTFTVNATASGGTTDAEVVRDTIGGALVAGSGVQITVNDAGDTITIASTAVLPTRQVISGTGLTGGGDLSADRTLAVSYGALAGTAVQGNDTRVTADQAAATPSIRTLGTGAQQAAAGNHTHTATGISDSTATGRSVLTATDAAAARTAIGAAAAGVGVYPLGCAENPITDPNAARPTGIPVVWWRTPSIPAAAATGDVVELPGTAVTQPSYLETFDATTGSWAALTNASALTRDTTVDGGPPSSVTASLRWTATAAGNSSVKSPAITGLTVGTSYVATAQVKLSGTGTKTVTFTCDFNQANGTYISGNYNYSTTVTAGASGFVYLTFAFTPVTNTGQVVLAVQVTSADLSQQAWIDNVRILA